MADQTTPGSFIPHDTAVSAPRVQHARSSLNDLFFLVAIVMLVASSALGAGVFLYEQFLQSQTTAKQEQLKRAEAAFEPALVEQITRLDDRMHAAQQILSSHLAPVAFFQALDRSTLQTVSFTTLDLNVQDPQHLTLKMQGVAQSVNSIALQAQVFSKSNVITNPIFSNIARQVDGVHFDFTGSVNPVAVNYASFLAVPSVTVPDATQAAPASGQQDASSSPDAAPSPFSGAPATSPSSQ